MPKSHPAYPAAFREQVIEFARAGRTPEEVAKECESSVQTIRNWIHARRRSAIGGLGRMA